MVKLALLPETASSLQALASLGQDSIADYLQAWQQAQHARLKHLNFQLTPEQREVAEQALDRIIVTARYAHSDALGSVDAPS